MKVHSKSKNEKMKRCQIFVNYLKHRILSIFCIHNTDVTTNYNEVMNKSIIWYKHVIHVCRVKYNQVSKSRNDDI